MCPDSQRFPSLPIGLLLAIERLGLPLRVCFGATMCGRRLIFGRNAGFFARSASFI